MAADAFDLFVAARSHAKRRTHDDILRSGLGLFDGVETVAAKLASLARMSMDHVMMPNSFGGLAEDKVARSMNPMTGRVLPRAKELLSAA